MFKLHNLKPYSTLKECFFKVCISQRQERGSKNGGGGGAKKKKFSKILNKIFFFKKQ